MLHTQAFSKKKICQYTTSIMTFKGLQGLSHVHVLINGDVILHSTVFQLYRVGQCTNQCFPGHTVFCPSHWLLSHITIVETTDSGERRTNPIPMTIMTIINPQNKYWPCQGSNHLFTLPTELRGSALIIKEQLHLQCYDK